MNVELKTGGLLHLPEEILAKASLQAGDQMNCEVMEGKIILTPDSFACLRGFPPNSWIGIGMFWGLYTLLERRNRGDSQPESQ